jgi:hypothetical protein
VPCCHDPILRPLDIEGTTYALHKIEHEKGELLRNFNEPSEAAEKIDRQTM